MVPSPHRRGEGGGGGPVLYEKASANLDAIARVLRRVLAKYDPTTEDVVLC